MMHSNYNKITFQWERLHLKQLSTQSLRALSDKGKATEFHFVCIITLTHSQSTETQEVTIITHG